MYNELIRIFWNYKGKPLLFHHRNETTDLDTIISIFQKDEYQTKDIGVRDGDVYIDIGAHIGAWPLLLSTLAKNIGVYAYEPIPENFELLRKNVENNDLQGVVYHFKKAVAGPQRKKLRIYYGDDSFIGIKHKFIGTPILNPPLNLKRNFVDAETITLEQIFKDNKISHCRILKIDCEGMEYEIFATTPLSVFEKIDYIIGEHHGGFAPKGVNNRRYLFSFVRDSFDDITFHPSDFAQGEFLFKNKKVEKSS